jgi:hypothetical protein
MMPPISWRRLSLLLCAAAALALPAVLIWKATTVIRPGGAVVVSPPSVDSAAEIAPQISPPPAVKPQAVTRAPSDDYTIACAIHGSGDIDDVIPCAKFGEAQRCQHEVDFPSRPTSQSAVLSVVNRSGEEIKFYWLNTSGARTLYASLPPGGHVSQQSHIGAYWLLSTRDERCIAIFNATTMTIGIF